MGEVYKWEAIDVEKCQINTSITGTKMQKYPGCAIRSGLPTKVQWYCNEMFNNQVFAYFWPHGAVKIVLIISEIETSHSNNYFPLIKQHIHMHDMIV